MEASTATPLPPASPLADFHPAVSGWFTSRFDAASEVQARAWPAIAAGRHTLVAAPTGSGKTLAAFLAALDDLVRKGQQGALENHTHVVYVSPLKALSNDIERNLQEPLAGIRQQLATLGLPDVDIRTFVRTGDTAARARTAMVQRPPHILVTTPESLYILLTSRRGRDMLRTARTVIVDEIHALVGNKRGSHLALSLERLDALAGHPLVRVGLSATQRPIEAVAHFLVGATDDSECVVIDAGHVRARDIAIEVPRSPLEVVMSGEVWSEVYDRIAALVREHRTTLVFVNTRRSAERVARYLSERLGNEHVASHHGSLSREQRHSAEQRLKQGQLRALVATASLELGIDIGDVDLVCQIGSTRSIAAFLQRVGRSGHALTGLPKGRLFPLSRDELVECVALLDAVRRGELDHLSIPGAPLDILAQQIVACVAAEDWSEDDLYTLVRRAWPYRDLERTDFDAVIAMLADGFATHRGRRSAHIHRDAINRRVRGRKGARIAAITGGGAIPDNADYQVVLEPAGTIVGTLNEDFAIESSAGDVFQLGNTSWRILRVEQGRVRVEDARGEAPTLPFWLGEAPSRSAEMSMAVSRLRHEIGVALEAESKGNSTRLVDRLVEELGLSRAAAEQMIDYLAAARITLGVLPTQERLVLERFFDEAGGMQLVLHSPYGSRANRAWGLALRKRFCRKFNFELQAAATEDAIVLSLGPTHSFPLAEVFDYLSPETVRDVLTQALLDAPMFATRWRWNATRALAVLRFRNGRKVPANLLRMQTDDLLTVVFPDQVACAENLAGPRQIPDHPLVRQTVRDCLEEAMDVDHLEKLLGRIKNGEVRLVARDVTEPSMLAQEILNARPYAFLDDAPLEERRTRAVMARRWLDPETASDLGALDVDAVRRVASEAWPAAEHPDELHDALVLLGFVAENETEREPVWASLFETLVADRRATTLSMPNGGPRLWIAAERLLQWQVVMPNATLEPQIDPPASLPLVAWEPDLALTDLVRGRLEGLGAVTMQDLAAPFGVAAAALEAALLRLESEGFVLRGHFTPGVADLEWCERRLLARIHRYTLQRLRAEIEPVASVDYIRFLLDWQRVAPRERLAGAQGVAAALDLLEGFESPAAAWEGELLSARVEDYDPAWLDAQCTSGRIAWTRLVPPRSAAARLESAAPQGPMRAGPVRSTPIVLVQRRHWPAWSALTPIAPESAAGLSQAARAVQDYLERFGAAFFDDLVSGTRLLRTEVESGLGELVASGSVSSDSFAGLRALLVPSSERKPLNGMRRRRRTAIQGVEDAGRWVLVRGRSVDSPIPTPTATSVTAADIEVIAQTLLRRWGVVFRRVLDREGTLPPWRELLRVYRRLEARGEIRGGRFVDGFAGEQFALPDAVTALRETRRAKRDGTLVAVCGADPLNLIGILTPGPRLAALTGNRLLYRDGVPIALREARVTRCLEPVDPAAEWQVRQALLRRGARQHSERLALR